MNEEEKSAPNENEPSDWELVQQFQEGNDQAFEKLIKRYEQRLFNTIFGIVRNHHEAEDVFQDVLLKVFKKMGKYNGESKFFTWLYRVGVNTTLDYIRKKKRRPTFSLEGAIEENRFPTKLLATKEEGPGEKAQWKEGAKMVEEVLKTMKPKHRMVLQLKELEGLSYQEIADVLKCSIGTVESRLYRARAQLKKKLEPLLRREG